MSTKQKGYKEILSTVKQLYEASFYDRNMDAVNEIYSRRFLDITNRYLVHSSWPASQDGDVRAEIDQDDEFAAFYQEIVERDEFVRELHATKSVSEKKALLEKNYNTYLRLFQFLNDQCQILVSDVWAFDIVNQFVENWILYHQVCSQLQEEEEDASLTTTTDEEKGGEEDDQKEEPEYIFAEGKAWDTEYVYTTLENFTNEYDEDDPRGNMKTMNLVGLYAHMALIRMTVHMGESTLTLTLASNLSLLDSRRWEDQPQLFHCRCVVLYYLGVAYMMNERYRDATLLFIQCMQLIATTVRSSLSSSSSSSSSSRNASIRFHDQKGLTYWHQFRLLQLSQASTKALTFLFALIPDLYEGYGDLSTRQAISSSQHYTSLLRELKSYHPTSPPPSFLVSFLSDSVLPYLLPSHLATTSAAASHEEATALVSQALLNKLQPLLDFLPIRSYLHLYSQVPLTQLLAHLQLPSSTNPQQIYEAYVAAMEQWTMSEDALYPQLTPEGEGAGEEDMQTKQSLRNLTFLVEADSMKIEEDSVQKQLSKQRSAMIKDFRAQTERSRELIEMIEELQVPSER
jgi:hypothetical protein